MTNKSNTELDNKLQKSEYAWKALMCTQNILKINLANKKRDFQKGIDNLKVQLNKYREVGTSSQTFLNEVRYSATIGVVHSKTFTSFTSLWKEYCDKYEPSDKEENVE